LTPIQHWFFEQLCDPPLEPGFTAKGAASGVPALLERAVQQLLEHHDALRLRFIPKSVGSK